MLVEHRTDNAVYYSLEGRRIMSTQEQPKKKKRKKIVLFVLLFLAIAVGIFWWLGVNGFNLPGTYTGNDVCTSDGETFIFLDEDMTVKLTPWATGTLTYKGEKYHFTYKFTGYTEDPTILKQRVFSVKFKDGSIPSCKYHSPKGKFERDLDLSDVTFYFFDMESLRDITLKFPIENDIIFNIKLRKE